MAVDLLDEDQLWSLVHKGKVLDAGCHRNQGSTVYQIDRDWRSWSFQCLGWQLEPESLRWLSRWSHVHCWSDNTRASGKRRVHKTAAGHLWYSAVASASTNSHVRPALRLRWLRLYCRSVTQHSREQLNVARNQHHIPCSRDTVAKKQGKSAQAQETNWVCTCNLHRASIYPSAATQSQT